MTSLNGRFRTLYRSYGRDTTGALPWWLAGGRRHRTAIRAGKLFPMNALLNVVWLVLCGFWLAVGYAVAGVVMCILIITIPFGIAAFRLSAYTLWPFGRTMVPKPSAGPGSLIGNVLWFLLAGLWMAIAHVVTGVALCLTIMGIPLGIADFKLAAVAIAPLGKDIVRTDDPRALYR